MINFRRIIKIRTSSGTISPKDSKWEGHLQFATVINFPIIDLPKRGGSLLFFLSEFNFMAYNPYNPEL
jgi:hypothetical protein